MLQQMQQNQVSGTSDASGFFSSLNSRGREVLGRTQRKRNLRKNYHLFHEGDSANMFFEIKKGLARTCRLSAGAKDQTFEINREGDIIGLRDCLTENKYNRSCVCMMDTEVFVYSLADLKEIMKVDPAFQQKVLRYMAESWCAAENRVHSLCTKGVHGRLAELLLSLPRKQGDEVKLDFTRETMASMLGTSTETIIRALSDFKARNWVDVNKGLARITNRLELARVAGLEEVRTAVAV